MTKRFIFTGLWAIAVSTLFSQQRIEAAFADGERLEYAVSYKVSLINTDVAGVTISTRTEVFNGRKVYTVEGLGKTYPFYRWFFDLNDQYVSVLDSATLRPLELRTEIREGKYRYSSRFSYDWDSMVVNNAFRNHARHPDFNHKRLKISEGSYDGLALFFNLRCADLSELEKTGGESTMNLVLEDTIRTIRYKLLGRETKNIRGMGRFRTLKFRCELATSTGESFADGSEFTIWITDDRNRIPVYIESPIRVGSIRARLTDYENLKYPLDSKIN